MLNKRENACFRGSMIWKLMPIGQPRSGLSKAVNTLIQIDMTLEISMKGPTMSALKFTDS